jgi:hypothetical protein
VLNTAVTIPVDRAWPLRENILRLLRNRLWLQKDVAEYPEIFYEEIVAPVVMNCLSTSSLAAAELSF